MIQLTERRAKFVANWGPAVLGLSWIWFYYMVLAPPLLDTLGSNRVIRAIILLTGLILLVALFILGAIPIAWMDARLTNKELT